MAAKQTGFLDDSSPYSQYPNHPSQSSQSRLNVQGGDYKASYDDLIDEYATPYGANAQHKTFNVQTAAPAPSLKRGPSHALTHKASIFSKSEDASESSHYTYPPPPPPPIKDVDSRGFWEKILPESMACRLYVITTLIETIIDLAIEAELLIRVQESLSHNDDDEFDVGKRKMPVYLSIFALAHVFQLVMAIDAVYARNTLQFISLALFNALFLFYAIVQIGEVREAIKTPVEGISNIPINVLTTIIPIVISVAELAYIGLGWKIYHEFGWKVYKFLGADRNIKKMYASYQIFECLVKFDVFFWVGFSVQFIWLVLQKGDWEYYITCAALPLSVILLMEGHLAARYENKWMMATFMSGCVGAMVYFVYKLVKVLIYRHTDTFELVYKSLSTFSVIAIILLIATFVFSVIVMRNFGRGLKQSIEKKAQQSSKSPHQRAASKNLNRMSID